MHAEPRSGRQDTGNGVIVRSDFCDCGVAADHSHCALVHIDEGLLFLAGSMSSDVVCAMSTHLLCHSSQLWEWLTIRSVEVGKVAQRIHSRVLGDCEIRLDVDPATMPRLDPERAGQRRGFEATRPDDQVRL